MNTHEVIQRERERLTIIGSNKDPALFQAMRAHVRDRRTQNRSVIVNFADEETQFGCRFKCKFCSWRDRATAAGDSGTGAGFARRAQPARAQRARCHA